MADQPLTKRYYTIGEVAEMFEVSKSLIRFWENEFPSLRPHKTGKGERRFTQKNIEEFRLIHLLVKERGFTLEGAKQEIKRQHDYHKERLKQLKRLKQIRKFLVELQEELG
jgi:DNA-binding transcriptional MerR regulator